MGDYHWLHRTDTNFGLGWVQKMQIRIGIFIFCASLYMASGKISNNITCVNFDGISLDDDKPYYDCWHSHTYKLPGSKSSKNLFTLPYPFLIKFAISVLLAHHLQDHGHNSEQEVKREYRLLYNILPLTGLVYGKNFHKFSLLKELNDLIDPYLVNCYFLIMSDPKNIKS